MIFHLTSKKPILILGNGARQANIADLVYEFIDKTKIPVLTTMNAVDLVQDKYKIGFIGTYGNRIANMIINECDLIISVGARLGLRQIGHDEKLFAPNAKLIRNDIDQYELARTVKNDEEQYLLDARLFMSQLINEDIPNYSDWFNSCMEAKNILDGIDDTEGNLLIKKISSMLPENPVVSVDIGQTVCWSAQSLHLRGTKGRIIIGGSYGAMGTSLPYSIGASISMNKGKVYCITGDGGLQMNIQELETIRRENLPIKIFVINNHELGKISEIQIGSYDGRMAQTTVESGYTVPNFVKIAEAYGIKSVDLKHYSEIPNYNEWIIDNEPCLININLSSGTKLIPKVKWDSNSIEPKIDNSIESKALELLRK